MPKDKNKNVIKKLLAQGHQALLADCLREFFAVTDQDFLSFLCEKSDFLELYSGDVLLNKGAESNDVYFLLSGRLRATLDSQENQTQSIGDIGRGEIVGELAMFTGEARSATVFAVRNSLVARISASTLDEAIKRNPSISIEITKQIINRYKKAEDGSKSLAPPVTIAVAALHDTIDIDNFLESLTTFQRSFSANLVIVDEEEINKQYGNVDKPDIARPRGDLSQYLAKLENEHDVVFLVTDITSPSWTLTALHHADEILLLGDANENPAQTPFEKQFLSQNTKGHQLAARRSLILLHDQETNSPKNTKEWLRARTVNRHFHIRHNNISDSKRIARILSGNAIGLVLSGGGARGFAHIGFVTALSKMGIEVDYIGGTSAGAIMGSWVAMGITDENFVDSARDIFVNSPVGNISGDYNPLPIVSLIKGNRANYVTNGAVLKHAGSDIDMEDSWKTFFVVASNYTTHSEQILTHGNFTKNVMASFSIPGLLPPTLIDGQMMYDGGSFNNFPVDVMQKFGVRHIIGVDLLVDYQKSYDMDKVPSPGKIFLDSFKPRKKRKYKFPSLPNTLVTASFITSMAKQRAMREQVDLLFQPKIKGVGMLEWKKFDEVVADTHSQAMELLESLPKKEIDKFKAPNA